MGTCFTNKPGEVSLALDESDPFKELLPPRCMKTLVPTAAARAANHLGIQRTHAPTNASSEAPNYAANTEALVSAVMTVKEAERGPTLKLIIIQSRSFNPQTELEIKPTGYKFSHRKANDGLVYMGTKEQSAETKEAVNDIVFSRTEIGMGNRHLVIKFSSETKSYYIKDVGEGTGTFIKIDSSIVLQNDYIISYGSSHMFVSISPDNKLHLKFLEGPSIEKSYTFEPRSGPIRIGRAKSCDIQVISSELSKCQCTLSYGSEGWIVIDGDGKQASTNGTWLFADDLFMIYDGMTFKAGQTAMRAKLLNVI